MTRTTITRTTARLSLAVALSVGAAACGDDDGGGGSAASESVYCDQAREWAIRELTPVDETDPVAFRAYWTEWVAFEDAALATAPAEIKADWERKVTAEREHFTPVLEKYGYDVGALMASGTPEERATTEAPPDVQAAQDRVLTYESQVCGAVQPLAADVAFSGEEPGRYCELAMAEDERATDVLAAGAEPAAIEDFVAGAREREAALVEAAPTVIEEDVAALAAWTVDRQAEALERHGWDIRVLLRDGSAQDRADLNYADEDIREQYARVTAYEEQVCSG